MPTLAHLALLLLAACIPTVFWGSSLISPVSLDLQTDPTAVKETALHMWQSRRNLGGALAAQGWLPVSLVFIAFEHIGVPADLAVRLWYAGVLLIAGTGMYLWCATLFSRGASDEKEHATTSNAKQLRWAGLVGSLIYMANPYTTMHAINGHFLVPYAAFSWQLLFLSRGLRSGKLEHAALLTLTSLFVATNLSLVVANYLALMFFALYTIGSEGLYTKRTMIFVLISCVGVMAGTAWFFLPPILLHVSGSGVLQAAAEAESWAIYGQSSSLSETLRLLGLWNLYAYVDETSNFYNENFGAAILTFGLPGAAICGAIIALKQNQKWITPLFLLVIFSLFMATGAHSSNPARTIYIFFYENIPFFQIFRNGYKFVAFIAFSYAVLISYFFAHLAFRLSTTEQRGKFLTLAGTVLLALTALPMMMGWTIPKSHRAQIPTYWNEAEIWLKTNGGSTDRVLLLPVQYFDVYEWGGYGGFQASVPFIRQQTLFTPIVKVGNEVVDALFSPFKPDTSASGGIDPVHAKAVCQQLQNLNISWVLQRNDFDFKHSNSPSPEEMQTKLDALPCLRKAETIGRLDIYRVDVPRKSLVFPIS